MADVPVHSASPLHCGWSMFLTVTLCPAPRSMRNLLDSPVNDTLTEASSASLIEAVPLNEVAPPHLPVTDPDKVPLSVTSTVPATQQQLWVSH